MVMWNRLISSPSLAPGHIYMPRGFVYLTYIRKGLANMGVDHCLLGTCIFIKKFV